MPMPLIPNIAVFQRKLAGFPIAAYQAGETVLTAASRTGRLLILRKGALAVLREGVEIATVREPGAVFGELSVLLDQPHTADVRALEASQFYVADAAALLRVDPIALLYVATVWHGVWTTRITRSSSSGARFRPANRSARSRKRSRRWKDRWAPAVLSMPAIPTTCSPPTHRTACRRKRPKQLA
jgi:Cyclic nucleotide-binding domain